MPNRTISHPRPPKRKARGFRFSDAFLSKLKVPPGKRQIELFEAGTGLGARVFPSGHITFVPGLRLKDGTRWREPIGAYGKLTIEAAREAVQALAGDIARGVDPRQKRAEEEAVAKAKATAAEAEKFTVGALTDRWRRNYLVTKRPSYATRTFRNVERVFHHLLDTPAAGLTRAEVKQALEQRQTQKTKKTGRGSRVLGGPSAVRNAAVSLRAAYRWALSEELIDQDPLNGLKLPGRAIDRDRVLSIDEARRIYAAAGRQEYPGQHFIRLAQLTGARRSEIAGLRWDEIVTEEDDQAIELSPKRTKTGAGHHIPLSREALAVIEDIKRRHRVVGSPYILTSDGCRPFGNFERVKARLDEALADDGGGIADWRWHDFCRTLVSTLAKRPFRYNPVTLDLLLGHQPSTLSPVARIYQREQHHDDRREALAAWGKHLAQPPATVSDLKQKRQRTAVR